MVTGLLVCVGYCIVLVLCCCVQDYCCVCVTVMCWSNTVGYSVIVVYGLLKCVGTVHLGTGLLLCVCYSIGFGAVQLGKGLFLCVGYSKL